MISFNLTLIHQTIFNPLNKATKNIKSITVESVLVLLLITHYNPCTEMAFRGISLFLMLASCTYIWVYRRSHIIRFKLIISADSQDIAAVAATQSFEETK